jgi:hypothetical protein
MVKKENPTTRKQNVPETLHYCAITFIYSLYATYVLYIIYSIHTYMHT